MTRTIKASVAKCVLLEESCLSIALAKCVLEESWLSIALVQEKERSIQSRVLQKNIVPTYTSHEWEVSEQRIDLQ